ncbi:MAG: DUF3299 domain-containing protein [Burkholderiales bacterium]|nr:DUF3299 domain-containing protein [Burkholderiales bacterium]
MKLRIFLSTVLMLGLGAAAAQDFAIGDRLKPGMSTAKTAEVKEITWDALIPPGWDPMEKLKGLKLDQLSDSDPKAMALLEQLRAEWDKAATVQSIDGAKIKIPGFVVMLDGKKEGVTEFLLVPFFGACIHVPPPPANQIIHVFPGKPVPDSVAMNPVYVTGTIRTARSSTSMGAAAYRIEAAQVEPYPMPQRGGRR